MNCPNCQTPIASGAYACPSCNAQLRPPPMDADLGPKGWGWSPLIGITYNKTPVGIIAVGVIIVLYFLVRMAH
jgi:hypothetical protein